MEKLNLFAFHQEILNLTLDEFYSNKITENFIEVISTLKTEPFNHEKIKKPLTKIITILEMNKNSIPDLEKFIKTLNSIYEIVSECDTHKYLKLTP